MSIGGREEGGKGKVTATGMWNLGRDISLLESPACQRIPAGKQMHHCRGTDYSSYLMHAIFGPKFSLFPDVESFGNWSFFVATFSSR